jgi:hypothetical protein
METDVEPSYRGLIVGDIPAFAEGNEENRETLVRIAGLLVEIRTHDLSKYVRFTLAFLATQDKRTAKRACCGQLLDCRQTAPRCQLKERNASANSLPHYGLSQRSCVLFRGINKRGTCSQDCAALGVQAVRQFTGLHGATSQVTVIFIVSASNRELQSCCKLDISVSCREGFVS